MVQEREEKGVVFVYLSQHGREVVPVSRHERDTVTTTHHYDDFGLSTMTCHCNGQTYDEDSDCDDDSTLQRRIIVAVTGQHCDDQFSCGNESALRRPI